MSSKATRMAKDIPEKTKTVNFKVYLEVGLKGTLTGPGIVRNKAVFTSLEGVPIDFPDEKYLIERAKAQVFNALNVRTFLEMYDIDEKIEESKTTFYNVKEIDFVRVTNVEKL